MPAVQTVPFVDLNRYVGLWYEIARYTKWFERGLTDVTAKYLLAGDYIQVINSGYKKGKLKTTTGKAYIVEGSGNAKLKVRFFWPFKGDYWIIDIDKDYRWSVVSDRKKSSLWILSREKTMNDSEYLMIIEKLKNMGFDISKLEKTHFDNL